MFKSLHILDTVLLPEWSTVVLFCLVIVVHESLHKLPAVFRKKARGVKTFEQNEDVYIFLVLPKFHIFGATEDSYMFSRRKIKLKLPWSSNSKRFHAPFLMHGFSFWRLI